MRKFTLLTRPRASLRLVLLSTVAGFIAPLQAAPPETEILRTLALASSLEIPPENVACEITGPSRMDDKAIAYQAVTVADVLSGYMHSAARAAENSRRSFECEGPKGRHCTLGYGREAGGKAPASDVYLRFRLDERDRIIPDSLACIEVP